MCGRGGNQTSNLMYGHLNSNHALNNDSINLAQITDDLRSFYQHLSEKTITDFALAAGLVFTKASAHSKYYNIFLDQSEKESFWKYLNHKRNDFFSQTSLDIPDFIYILREAHIQKLIQSPSREVFFQEIITNKEQELYHSSQLLTGNPCECQKLIGDSLFFPQAIDQDNYPTKNQRNIALMESLKIVDMAISSRKPREWRVNPGYSYLHCFVDNQYRAGIPLLSNKDFEIARNIK
jgi:hypothetical protein